MSETTNGNGGNGYLAGGAAQLLDRKIDSVERDLRDGLSSLSADFGAIYRTFAPSLARA